jgi:hypothetical protein
MNASSSDRLIQPFSGALAPAAAADSQTAAARSTWSPQLVILTVFWIYVAISNVLYANGMQADIAATLHITERVYAYADSRLIQHALLYPLLVGFVWLSLRVGWQPRWRTLPLQILIAVVFAAFPHWILQVGEWLTGAPMKHQGHWSIDDGMLAAWLASFVNFLLTYGFALALLNGFAFYRRMRDSQVRAAALEQALSSAQLAALRMQLSPHTLFNLLHTIRGHIAWDPPAAQAMIVQLGDLLRRLLAAGEREFTPLTDELQFVRLYLGLQQRRFADRLTLAIPERESLPAAWVPSLILQPLVENAVVHGLAGHDGPVSIRVEVLARGEALVLRVANTIAPSRATGAAGIGLNNVRERLAIQFGARASFSAGSADDNVWIAEVRMPLLRDGPREAAGRA